jgi:hypothetical protein
MRPIHLLTACLFAPLLSAQTGDLLYTTSQNEFTLGGSGGTVLRDLHPNDIVGMPAFPCFMTMAGDEDGDDSYFEPGIMGAIDALLTLPAAGTAAAANARTIWYSPRTQLGTAVSGIPGLRPGDIGRIVRNTAGDGRVQYFIRRELINQALGLPVATPIDVDAAAFGPNHGLFLSLDTDIACSPCGGPTLLRDGDVFALPPGTFTFTGVSITGVVANSALIVYTEAAMDLMVATATVANNTGACVPNAIDVESLEFDWTNPGTGFIPGCTGTVLPLPSLLFTTETTTGGAILTTAFGGQIAMGNCGPLGTVCGSGPTLGNQIGLLPPSAATGIPSFVNALAHSRVFTFTAESKVHQIPIGTAPQIDFNTPGLMCWVFLTFAPTGPAVVAPSSPFVWGTFGHPDYYNVPNFMNTIPGGFATYTGPVIPWACDLIFQGVTITSSGTIEASTPTMVEVS